MTREENRKNNNHTHFGITLSIGLFLLASIFLIYNILLLGPIEPFIRYIVVIAIIIINFLKIIRRKVISKKSIGKKRKFIIFNILFSILFLIIGAFIYKFYISIDGLSKSNDNYSSSIVVKKESSFAGAKDLKDTKLGMIRDDTSYEGYIIPEEMIEKYSLEKNNDIVSYDNYTDLIDALYNDSIDGAFLPTNYINMFSNLDGYENINNETKIVATKTKTIKKKTTLKKSKINKPITVLLTGIDSNVDGMDSSSSSNSDTLIVVTFNPDTLTATMLSIPRDSYVPISCNGNAKSKITHAGWQGVSCVENTIENFLDIDIDYYVKLNFKGLVGLVDALGGIDVSVPKDLCTDSSDRTGEVCIKEGMQHLNGEEALVLARNRKQLALGDIDRGLNQQIVIKGILNAVSKNITNVKALSNLLASLSRNMDTNFSTDEILSFYNVGKDILRKSNKSATDSINIIQLYLLGHDAYIYDEKSGLDLYYYILYKESVSKVSEAMNANLKKTTPSMEKKFSWSIDDNYQHIPLGKSIDSFTTLYYSASNNNRVNDSKNKVESKEDEDIDLDDDKDISSNITDSTNSNSSTNSNTSDKEKPEEDDPLDVIMP